MTTGQQKFIDAAGGWGGHFYSETSAFSTFIKKCVTKINACIHFSILTIMIVEYNKQIP